ncbi:hypothetical protein [uncultured Croceitalea sp.]|uniref:tetratricopeptide repeat protein n=1 Tax=uncultured Croceitalea sp. TaxID=1798908 RepID=UPI003305EC7F
MKNLFLIFFISFSTIALGQYNCEAFKLNGDLCKYKACKYLDSVNKPFQLTKGYHDIYNKALEICPNYHQAYRNKSTAYLKTGEFIMWKKLMDKAVELSPEEHLSYRGWCRYQFFRDYKGALKDLEALEKIYPDDLGYSQNGMYHLKVVQALCQKMLNQPKEAISTLEKHLKKSKFKDLYDYYHLGILYSESGQYEKALSAFKIQIKEYDFDGLQYHLALLHKKLGNLQEYRDCIFKTNELHKKGRVMTDPYTHPLDFVFKSDIVLEYENVYAKKED